jgi:hypothetical protein
MFLSICSLVVSGQLSLAVVVLPVDLMELLALVAVVPASASASGSRWIPEPQ